MADNEQEWLLPTWFFEKMIEKTLEACEGKLPKVGRFQPFHVAFAIPGTENVGVVEVECPDYKAPNDRLLKTLVFRKGTDHAYNHFMKKGSSAEIVAYLKSEVAFKELYDSIHELSDSVEEN